MNTKVSDNIIGDTTASQNPTGIWVTNSTLIELVRNSVFNLLGDPDWAENGLYINNSIGVTAIDNRILDSATGDIGLNAFGFSTGINCIDNTIAGFTTATNGCDYVSGNHTP